MNKTFLFILITITFIPSCSRKIKGTGKSKSVGSLAGLAGTIGAISVVIMNYLIPKITTVSYTPAFIILAVLAPLAALSIFILIKEIKPLEK